MEPSKLINYSTNTWASLTLIILFSEMLKISKKISEIYFLFFLKENKESDEIF
jgi:hypothetical protein